jgi:hypothetical protein
MIHFLWSIFFLVCTMGLVLVYVCAFGSVLFMLHYIAINNWRYVAEKNYGRDWGILFVGGKLLLYLFVPMVLVFFCYLFPDFNRHDRWAGFGDARTYVVLSRGFLVSLSGTLFCLIANTLIISRRNQMESNEASLEFSQYYKGKLARGTLIFCLVSMVCVYGLQMRKWMGRDNANLDAKQYWVAGQTLNGFRQILTTFIHPDIPIMVPADLLQHWIYERGARYLPENDGEIGVWQNAWFHYHYSKKGRRALWIVSEKPSARMVHLLDQWWLSLKLMATKPFADKQMEVEHYYRDFASLAFSYEQYKGYYSGKKIASAHHIAQMPEQIEKARLLSQWLWALRHKWQNSYDTAQFIQRHPKVEAMLEIVVLFQAKSIIQGEIYARTFACGNESIQSYMEMRKIFAEPDSGKPAYARMKSRTQGQRLYRMAIESAGARSTKYVIKQYCGYEPVGKEDNSSYESWAETHKITPAKEAARSASNNYMDEVEILEEMFND